MVKKVLLFSALIFITAHLTACSSSANNFSRKSPQVVVAPDSVSAMLAEAADRASAALETLAAVENEKTQVTALAPVSNAPVELRRAVTVNWIGPVEIITKTLADRAGYTFQVIGNTPPIPVVVSVDVQNEPIIDILRNIGLQLGLRANVKVDSALRIIEVEYPATTGATGTI